MFKALLGAAALAVCTAAQPVVVTVGVDFFNLKISLIDLDPTDGIEPLHDTSGLVGLGRGSGPGATGAADIVPSPDGFGVRGFTFGRGGRFAQDFEGSQVGTLLSPHTGIVFSALARVSVGELGQGEGGGGSAALFAGFDRSDSVEISGSAIFPAEAFDIQRVLTIRYDNISDVTQEIFYGESRSLSGSAAPVPEASTYAMLILGLPLVVAMVRRRRRG